MASEDTATQAITAAELQRLPSRGGRYRLIKGELRTMPPAGGEHGSVAMHLEEHHGRYRTRETILAVYDELIERSNRG
jgi:Uma2 family endonuclease